MFRNIPATVATLVLAATLVAAPAPTEATFAPIELKDHTNYKLKESFHGENPTNNTLAPLPTGKQTFGGVKFTVGDGLIQLGSVNVKGPKTVEGIKVGRRATKLHFLHAAGCGYNTADDTLIGKYVVHYDDKSKAEIDIVYGQDVIDWWVMAGRKEPTRGKVAWEGENEAVKGSGTKIKLFLLSWENPHPKKKVASIDFVTTKAAETEVAPFCVGITAEDK